MANIRVDVDHLIHDGSEIKFRSPVDCSAITGLVVHYPDSTGSTVSKEFTFTDAHGSDISKIDHPFGENVVVKVILDFNESRAFVQNADTNAYLEAQLAGKAPAGYGYGGEVIVTDTTKDTTEAELETILTTMFNSMKGGETKQIKFACAVLGNWTFRGILFKNGDSGDWGSFVAYAEYRDTVVELRKAYQSRVWQPFEWVNPYFDEPGKEYRTTERFDGKAVYAKLIDFKSGVSGTKKIELDNNVDCLVRIEGYWYYTTDNNIKHFFESAPWLNYISTGKENGQLYMYVNSAEAATAYTGRPVIYYTKK